MLQYNELLLIKDAKGKVILEAFNYTEEGDFPAVGIIRTKDKTICINKNNSYDFIIQTTLLQQEFEDFKLKLGVQRYTFTYSIGNMSINIIIIKNNKNSKDIFSVKVTN